MVCLKNNGLLHKSSTRIFVYALAMDYFFEREIHVHADTIAVILDEARGIFRLRKHDLGQSRTHSQKI